MVGGDVLCEESTVSVRHAVSHAGSHALCRVHLSAELQDKVCNAFPGRIHMMVTPIDSCNRVVHYIPTIDLCDDCTHTEREKCSLDLPGT